MQALEALTRLLSIADIHLGTERARRAGLEEGGPELDEMDRKELAVSICQAMLNTALPVARYRAFVEVDREQPKRSKFQDSVAPRDEYTICGVTMDNIIAGLVGITHVPTNVKVSVFEQRADGADMISGYQGQTKGKLEWARFLNGLKALETMPTVQ